MDEEKTVSPQKIRALRIANIVFTILSLAAFVIGVVFFASAMQALVDTAENSIAGIGYALCFMVYLIVGVVGAVLAIVGGGISLGWFKQRKPESLVHLLINVIVFVALIVFLVALTVFKP